MKPLAIDLYCGLGGWAEGFLAEGFDVIGFDIERRPYPGQLVLQDVLTLHGRQLKDATVIVGSSPCQEFSYRAMPWKRAKELPPPNLGIQLFNAQFFLQKEASEAAGRYIPMVVENVKGAQPWIGRAQWHYGSYYLWGDVPAIMPFAKGKKGVAPQPTREKPAGTGKTSWFFGQNADPRTGKGADRLFADGKKVSGINWNGHGEPDYKPQGFNVVAAQRYREGLKGPGGDWFQDGRQGQDACAEGIKQGGEWWHDPNGIRQFSSRSDSRKAASAAIAKIPFPLALHIARCFKR